MRGEWLDDEHAALGPWTLSEKDRAWIDRYEGVERLAFALTLKCYRIVGKFPWHVADIDDLVVAHVAEQVGVDADLRAWWHPRRVARYAAAIKAAENADDPAGLRDVPRNAVTAGVGVLVLAALLYVMSGMFAPPSYSVGFGEEGDECADGRSAYFLSTTGEEARCEPTGALANPLSARSTAEPATPGAKQLGEADGAEIRRLVRELAADRDGITGADESEVDDLLDSMNARDAGRDPLRGRLAWWSAACLITAPVLVLLAFAVKLAFRRGWLYAVYADGVRRSRPG
ncbi:DUF4158 domain-containing protein [Amycolatopsis sp. CA-230715]|uniref:DUF4158 domain-containing protein n=1 Tax=Amycolatopsis sp. CA-230715 TaxID=2745196 RepID=UPI001C01D626|nr:DUF4158 domain-containing protein [Amycolatopsis sp. CA-230715]QWF77563.1 hypothetical protein HUW46_00955 [Amycolatopsis sp. CA-230715]